MDPLDNNKEDLKLPQADGTIRTQPDVRRRNPSFLAGKMISRLSLLCSKSSSFIISGCEEGKPGSALLVRTTSWLTDRLRGSFDSISPEVAFHSLNRTLLPAASAPHPWGTRGESQVIQVVCCSLFRKINLGERSRRNRSFAESCVGTSFHFQFICFPHN